MSKDYWKEVLDTALQKREHLRIRRDELDAEREEINLEVVQIDQLIEHLAPLASDAPLEEIKPFLVENISELNLADACREILKKSNTHMTPIQIRNTLAASKYDLNQYSNPLASIHGVLKRMVESGEVEKLSHEEKGTMYRWKAPVQSGTSRSHKSGYYGGGALPDMNALINTPSMNAAIKAATIIDKNNMDSIGKSIADAAAKMTGDRAIKTAIDGFREMVGTPGETIADAFRQMTEIPVGKKKK